MKRFFGLCLLGVLSAFGWAGEDYLRVAVTVTNKEDVQILSDSSLEIMECHVHLGENDVLLKKEDFAKLWELGLPYEVKGTYWVPDPEDNINPAVDDYLNQFLPYTNMINVYEGWRTANPQMVSRQSLGTTINNNTMYAYRVFNGRTTPANRKSIVISALTHAREWITGSVSMYLMDTLIQKAKKEKFYAKSLMNMDVYFIPCLNPDGYIHSHTTTRLWRKNRRNNGNGTFGVDINRNFPTGWGGSGSSGSTSSDTYRGPSSASERETQNYIAFMNSLPNPKAVIDYHSYSQLVLWPNGYTTTPIPEPARTNHLNLGNQMVSAMISGGGLPYTNGPISTTLYLASGGTVDHWFATRGMLSYTIELRDTGVNGFILPTSQIIPSGEEAWDAFDVLFRHVAAMP